MVGFSVCHNFLKGREVTPPCLYWSTCFEIIYKIQKLNHKLYRDHGPEVGIYKRRKGKTCLFSWWDLVFFLFFLIEILFSSFFSWSKSCFHSFFLNLTLFESLFSFCFLKIFLKFPPQITIESSEISNVDAPAWTRPLGAYAVDAPISEFSF